jgi:hypothetical protein
MDALVKAEHAHSLCREAAELGRKKMYKEAEESATRGINQLKERSVSTHFLIRYLITDEYHCSVLGAPVMPSKRLSELWDEELAMTA